MRKADLRRSFSSSQHRNTEQPTASWQHSEWLWWLLASTVLSGFSDCLLFALAFVLDVLSVYYVWFCGVFVDVLHGCMCLGCKGRQEILGEEGEESV